MQIRWNRALLTLVALLLLAGCASQQSSTPPDVWRDPNYAGPPFKKVFVIGLSSKDLTDRRGFEDLMVGKLQAGGVQAVPAWQFLPNSGQADRDTMMAAYARSGADAVLLARFMGFATKDAIVPAPVYGGGVVIATSGGGAIEAGMYNSYSNWYATPVMDTQYQVATIYTTLFNGKTMNPVWTYNPKTFDPNNLQQQANGYANEVAGLLQSAGLLQLK